jgi:hypothetical protein
MAKRKSRAIADSTLATKAETILANGLLANPDVQTVMEIAMRAREVEALELALDVDMTTEVRAIPVNSQGLWRDPA